MPDPFEILLVDDDPTVIGLLGSILQDLGHLRFATSGPDALRMVARSTPDLVLMDIEMPGMNGFEVCGVMKGTPELVDVPIIFITGYDDTEREVAALAIGAADFISKPPRAAQVLARVRMHLRVKELTSALRSAAYTDALTELANRRHFDDALHREWLRAQRAASPMSLVMIDVDAFKKYNDHYGHGAGDRCLAAVARAIRQSVHRPADLAVRYGGEEFAVLLPDTDACGARFLAQMILRNVETQRLPHAASPVAGRVTVSIGVSSYDDQCQSWAPKPRDSRSSETLIRVTEADLVAAADRALYAAKDNGRDQAQFLCIDGVADPQSSATSHPIDRGCSTPLRVASANEA